jgi:RHS repeat-associated protein
VNGADTNFTMDFNTGLTQALSDGANTYTYGLGRIAQTNAATTDYLLGDALGSVRQLTDSTGAVTLAQNYDPNGTVSMTGGTGSSSYGYTGEYQANDLVYLRARQYSPSMGRFLSRDTWAGNPGQPISFNRWAYANANPVRYTDPSGLCGGSGELPCIPTPPHQPSETPQPPTPEPTHINPDSPTQTPAPIVYDPCLDHPEIPCRCDKKPFLPHPSDEGYLEGISLTGAVVLGGGFGQELVYDFATMTRARFTTTVALAGLEFGDTVIYYVGYLNGFSPNSEPNNRQIIIDYSGSSSGCYGEVSAGITVGDGYFKSDSSNVSGRYGYAGVSSGPVPVGRACFSSYAEINRGSIKYYSDPSTGKVRLGEMITDIMTGDQAPFGIANALGGGSILTARALAVVSLNFAETMYRRYAQWKNNQ